MFLNCPRCGLSIRKRADRPEWLTLEHCPRCLGRARIPVKLVSATGPGSDWHRSSAISAGGQRISPAPPTMSRAARAAP